MSFRAGGSRASRAGSTGLDPSLLPSACGFRSPAGRRCSRTRRKGECPRGRGSCAGHCLARARAPLPHRGRADSSVARTGGRPRPRTERGPAWGGSFPPRSLRPGALQPRRLSLRGDLRVVLKRGRLGKFGFAQSNRRLRKVERSVHEGVGRRRVAMEASESEDLTRKTARWAVATLQKTIRL